MPGALPGAQGQLDEGTEVVAMLLVQKAQGLRRRLGRAVLKEGHDGHAGKDGRN